MHARRLPVLAVLLPLALASAPVLADELDSLAQAIDHSPDDASAYEAYARAAFGKRQFDDAIARLKVGVARIPDFARGYYLLAYAYREKHAWADAADYYRIYIALRPKETSPYFGLGKSLEELGDKKGATAALKKFVAEEKSPAAQKYVDEANQDIAKLEPPPAPAETPAQLKADADALRAQGKLDEAVPAYKKAIDADRNNLDLYNTLGETLYQLKRFDEAAAVFQKATERDPSYAFGWFNLARCYRKLDKRAEAVDAYKHYIALKPEDPDPYYGMGQALKGLGDYPGAIAAFRKYVEMEKRPAEQKWVEKARQELAGLEAMARPAAPAEPGKLMDEKSAVEGLPAGGAPVPATPEDPASGGLLAPEGERHPPHLRDLHDPFQDLPDGADEAGPPWAPDGLLNPFPLRHPEQPGAGAAPHASRAREYGQAVAAYRRALAAHVEDVSTRYERGVAHALAGRPHEATAAWDTIALDDGRVVQARRSIERIRAGR